MSRLTLLGGDAEQRWKLLEPLPPLREADVIRVREADGGFAGVERGRAFLQPDRGIGRLLHPRLWSTALEALELLSRLRHPWTPPLFQGSADTLLDGVLHKYDTALEAAQYRALTTAQLFDIERALVERHVLPGSRILDIGCGAGREAVGLARLGYRVVGIDVSPRMIDAARAGAARLGLSIEFRVQNVTALDEPCGSFDAAFFAGSLQHLPGRALRVETLGRIARALKPAGVLILMVRYTPRRGVLSRGRLVDAVRAVAGRVGCGRAVSEPGDTYMREVSEGSDPARSCFFHYYPGAVAVRAELEAAGLRAHEEARGWWVCRPGGACATVGAASSTTLTGRSER